MRLNQFPDLYRYTRQELKPQRVIAGLGLLSLVCLSFFLLNRDGTPNALLSTARAFLILQGLAWVVIAPAQSSGAISGERSDRTWDFQRLTPLTSFQTCVGKLIGAPIFALMMGAFLIPWSLFLTLGAGSDYLSGWLRAEFALIGMAFLSNSIGLMISANPTVKHGRSSMIVGPIIGIAILGINSSLTVLENAPLQQGPIAFYRWEFSWIAFFLLNIYVFGVWAFIAAKWEIGRDYLERMVPWRFATFLIFVAIYLFGVVKPVTFTNLVLYLMAIFIYSVAAVQPFEESLTVNQWLKRARTAGTNAVSAIPVWVLGFLAYIPIVLGSAAATGTFTAVSLIVFLLRDLILLEGARFLKFKQSKAIMMWATAFLYILPTLLKSLIPKAVFAAFIPLAVSDNWTPNSTLVQMMFDEPDRLANSTAITINCASGALQVALAWWLVRGLAKTRST